MATGDVSDRDHCHKCDEQISVKAECCPECGYEPGGTLATLLAVLLGLPMALFGGLLLLVIPVVFLGEGIPIGSMLIVLCIAVVLAGAGGTLLYMIKVSAEQKPVDDPPWDPE